MSDDLASVERTDRLLDRLAGGRPAAGDLDDPAAALLFALAQELDVAAPARPVDGRALVERAMSARSLDEELAAGAAPVVGGAYLRHARVVDGSPRALRLAPLAAAAAAALLVAGVGLTAAGGPAGLDDLVTVVLGGDVVPVQEAHALLEKAQDAADRGDTRAARALVERATRILPELSAAQKVEIRRRIQVVEQKIAAAPTAAPTPPPATVSPSAVPTTVAPTPSPTVTPEPAPTTPAPTPSTPQPVPTPTPTAEPSPDPSLSVGGAVDTNAVDTNAVDATTVEASAVEPTT